MSESIKFAGKGDNGNVVPVNLSNDGHIRNERIYNNTYTDIVNAVIDSATKTFYNGYDARKSGIISLFIWNRTGVSMNVQFYNPSSKGSGSVLMPIYDIDGNLPIITIPHNQPTVITADDLPILNYMPYINISVELSGAPTTQDTSVVRLFDKR